MSKLVYLQYKIIAFIWYWYQSDDIIMHTDNSQLKINSFALYYFLNIFLR
jgi:hypothetical protein